ncbi:MAG TPA: D-alanyl-D-alanine carboxypeptidase family protein, partial [Chthonomonadales bacterium]|nr:D-alanyl-D-alanine carboxypeptidase family protein [Chthonomonadales bacterium]
MIDAVSGQVLYARNADIPRPPASTTKIMTAILLLEHTRPEDIITASKHACETEGSGLHLKPGEKVSARDMLYALMLRSANDGCVAVAEHIAGSEARFAQMMTAKAREIGATDTTFKNSHGLDSPGHRTTARDLALIARYASIYPEFNEVTRTKFYNLTRSSNSKDVLLRNHAKFLWKFPGADGVKTGYTNPAGRCFVGGATWNGWRLISVVLNSPDVVGETTRLMKYGFQ